MQERTGEGEYDDFISARDRALAAHGVEAEHRRVAVELIGGAAGVVTVGSGPDVVLLNGIGLPGSFWAPLLAELDGFRLHAVDLPGFGWTDCPASWPGPDLRAGFGRFVLEVVDGLGLEGPVPIVANSLGGRIACHLAIDHPDRVAGLGLVGCPALVLDTAAPPPLRLLSVGPVGRLLLRLDPPSAKQVERLARMVGEDLSAKPELRDLLVATERLPGNAPTFLSIIGRLLSIRGQAPGVALDAGELARIDQPVQLVWGREDTFGDPEVARRVNEALPSSELDLVDGGHAPWLGNASTVADSLASFLHSITGPAAEA